MRHMRCLVTDTLCSGDDPLLSPACSPGPAYQERGLDSACAVEGYMEHSQGAGADTGAMEHMEHMEKPGARSYM